MPYALLGTAAMPIVADTNTVLSGLLWQGPPRRLLEFARERKVSLCTSLTLVAELAEVHRPREVRRAGARRGVVRRRAGAGL